MNCRPLLMIFAILIGFLQSACAVKYLGVQGVYQLNMLTGREDIHGIRENDDISDVMAQKLDLILAIRAYAQTHLAMHEVDSYRTANLQWSGTIINVSASSPTSFRPQTWWFPIVGRVPYLGYFREKDARREIEGLRAKGLDVASYPVAAYSTLGFFSDPILPHMLEFDDLTLIELLIHEMAHGILYFKDQADFNESFATFVAHEGLRGFLEAHYADPEPLRREFEGRLEDKQLRLEFLRALYAELETLYMQPLPEAEILAQKAALLEAAQARYAALDFKSARYQKSSIAHLNNAHLMSYRRYHSGSAVFESLLDAVDGDWEAFYRQVKTVKKEKAPFEALAGQIPHILTP